MLERDIYALNARERVNLDGLEADIWHRERHLLALRAATRLLASWQGLVLALAVIASALAGVAAARYMAPPSAFMAEENMAPSTLLLGRH